MGCLSRATPYRRDVPLWAPLGSRESSNFPAKQWGGDWARFPFGENREMLGARDRRRIRTPATCFFLGMTVQRGGRRRLRRTASTPRLAQVLRYARWLTAEWCHGATVLETVAVDCRALRTADSQYADIECKHFFGGAAAYVNDRILMSLTNVGLALKLPERDRNSLMNEGAKPLKHFPKAPAKKVYVVLPSGQVERERPLAVWITRSITYVHK